MERNATGLSPGTLADYLYHESQNLLAEVWGDPDDHRRERFKYLDINQLTDCALHPRVNDPDELDVIPEAFLWHVFDQLADAALVMHRGAEPLIGERAWREIVHRDLHLGNILLRPAQESLDGLESENGFIWLSKTEVSVSIRS